MATMHAWALRPFAHCHGRPTNQKRELDFEENLQFMHDTIRRIMEQIKAQPPAEREPNFAASLVEAGYPDEVELRVGAGAHIRDHRSAFPDPHPTQ